MVFRECLEALIVCTGNEEIVMLHGRDNTVGEIKKYPTIMLEVVASQDLWIWHAFFGMPGANNDINVLDNSSLFDDLLNDTTPVLPYEVNGVGRQECALKDVERAFGVLQGRWRIIQQPARAYEVNTIR
ncbi:ALP1-like protein [Tanacetum coccineum]